MDEERVAEAQRYACPRHGEHQASMHITITGVLKRVYCMHCYIEVLDKLRVSEMDPIGKLMGGP